MAAKFDAEYNRSEVFHFNPSDIVVHLDNNGRWMGDGSTGGHTPEDIEEMVSSYLREVDGKAQGQLQPVVVRKVDGKPELVLGIRRYLAACEYNKRFPDKPMRLACVYKQLSDEEVIVRNLEENRVRKGISAVDIAFAQEKLRNLGWKDTDIATRFDMQQSYVSKIKKLLKLDNETLGKVHRKELSVDAACLLADLPDEERVETLKMLAAESGDNKKIKGKAVKNKVRKKKGKGQRTLSEVKEFFLGLTGPAELEGVRSLATLMGEFVAGKVSEEKMTEGLTELFAIAEVAF